MCSTIQRVSSSNAPKSQTLRKNTAPTASITTSASEMAAATRRGANQGASSQTAAQDAARATRKPANPSAAEGGIDSSLASIDPPSTTASTGSRISQA